jgi:hypothetical protein
MIQDCKVLLIRVPRRDDGKVVTGGEYRALIATKANVLLDGQKVIYREWVEVTPMLTMATDYEELFRKTLAKHICAWLGIKNVGRFKFDILDKLITGKDYDIPFDHLIALWEKKK